MHGHGKLNRLPILGDPTVMFYKHLLRAYHFFGMSLGLGKTKETNRALWARVSPRKDRMQDVAK